MEAKEIPLEVLRQPKTTKKLLLSLLHTIPQSKRFPYNQTKL